MMKKFLFAVCATLLLISGGTADAKFLQPDWWEVTNPMVGTNRYAYSLNDPINLSDPSGNAPDYGYNTPGSYHCGCSNGYYDAGGNFRTDDNRDNNDPDRFIDNYNASIQYAYEAQVYRDNISGTYSTEALAEALNGISGTGFYPSPGNGALGSGDEIFALIPGYKAGALAFQSTRAMVAALSARTAATNTAARSLSAAANPVFQTTKEAAQVAKSLGFRKVKPGNSPVKNSHGQAVFTDGKTWISRDVDGHLGGAWKAFDRSGNRIGTYNRDLSVRIGN